MDTHLAGQRLVTLDNKVPTTVPSELQRSLGGRSVHQPVWVATLRVLVCLWCGCWCVLSCVVGTELLYGVETLNNGHIGTKNLSFIGRLSSHWRIKCVK